MKLKKDGNEFLLEALEFEYPYRWVIKGQGFGNLDSDWLVVSMSGKCKEGEKEMKGPYVRLGELTEFYETLVRVGNGFLKEGNSSFSEPNLKIGTVRKPESVDITVNLTEDEDKLEINTELSLEEFDEFTKTLESEIEKCSEFD